MNRAGRSAPIVGIPCDRRLVGNHPFHRVGEKYINAVRDGSGALPFLIPSLTPALPIDDILNNVDGLLFTGSVSNVAPHFYGGHEPRRPELMDLARDETTLPLMRAGLARGLPMLCICRGFQELNVALGGTLHQHLSEVPGFQDHREDEDDPLDVQYGPSHSVEILEGGLLAKIAGARSAMVNSLHSQGIDRLATTLRIDAVAPDGPIEAISLTEPTSFLLGAQWHPEWKFAANPLSVAIFRAFGTAIAERAAARA